MGDASQSRARRVGPQPGETVREAEPEGRDVAWDLVRTGVGRLIDALAQARPAPGGGAAACVGAALGEALLAKAARITLGRLERTGEGAVEEQSRLADLARQALANAYTLLDQAEADGEAFEAIVRALRLAHADEAQRRARAAQLAKASQGALDVTLTIARCLFDGLARARELEGRAVAAIAPDVRAARALLWAALSVTLDNAKANARDDSARARVAELAAQARIWGLVADASPGDGTPP